MCSRLARLSLCMRATTPRTISGPGFPPTRGNRTSMSFARPTTPATRLASISACDFSPKPCTNPARVTTPSRTATAMSRDPIFGSKSSSCSTSCLMSCPRAWFSCQQSMRHRQPQWLAQRDDLPHTLGINDLEGDESQRLLIHIEFAGCANQMAQVTDEKLKHVAAWVVRHPDQWQAARFELKAYLQ